MADAYWRGGVDPGLAPFSGYAHGMVGSTPAPGSQPRQSEEQSGVRPVDSGRGAGACVAPAPPPRAPFYSFRALFVPKVPSTPLPARRSFARRLLSFVLALSLPAAAGIATYAALTHQPPPASYVFVANPQAQPVDLVVDGAPRGSIPPRGSARLELGVGPHVITALAPKAGQGATAAGRELVDEATVQVAAPGSRVLFNLAGGASLAVVTRGYGATPVDRVQPVPAGRVLALPPEVTGDAIDQPFPPTVTAPEGQSSATVAHLCSFDPAKRRVGCQER
jgi:hypothetical protein